jgi:Papain-like cysteine protease AvrRpt2
MSDVMDRTRTKIPIEDALSRFEPRTLPNNPLALDVSLQEACNWCWAAVTSHINNFLSPMSPVDQCGVVTAVVDPNNVHNCCNRPVPGPCDKRRKLSVALEKFGHFHDPLEPPDEQIVIDQVTHGFPVGARIEWRGSTNAPSHFVAVYGFVPAQGGEGLKFNVADPATGADVVVADKFRDHYPGDGTWETTYRTK